MWVPSLAQEDPLEKDMATHSSVFAWRIPGTEEPVLCHSSHISLPATPWSAARQVPPSMWILQARILEWVAIPFSRGSSQPRDGTQVSRIASRLLTVTKSHSCDLHGLQPPRLLHPWDSPGKNTGVGCHFLFQCMRVKSESEVTQSCPTLSDTMDYSLPGSSIHGILRASVLEWVAIAFSIYAI